MTKKEMLAALEHMPDNTELEIHLESDDGSSTADFALEAIGEVAGNPDPPFFTFRAGDFISDC